MILYYGGIMPSLHVEDSTYAYTTGFIFDMHDDCSAPVSSIQPYWENKLFR